MIFVICKGIYKEKLYTDGLDTEHCKIGAMDIGCGYHSYLFSIARCHKQVRKSLFLDSKL